MSCNFCGGRLNSGMLRKQEPGSGRKFKSCPNCSTTHGEEHIFHPYPTDFGNTPARVTAAIRTGIKVIAEIAGRLIRVLLQRTIKNGRCEQVPCVLCVGLQAWMQGVVRSKWP